jgi:hypothetical protein
MTTPDKGKSVAWALVIAAILGGIASAATFNTMTSSGNIFSLASLTTWADATTCTPGQMTWDASFIYVCTATNTAKRATLATF